LQGLSNLEELDIQGLDENPTPDQLSRGFIIPLDSAKTLTTLTIMQEDNYNELFTLPLSLLNSFESLDNLRISPLTTDVCDFLLDTPLTFTNFAGESTEFWSGDPIVPTSKLILMMSARSLRNVRHLGLAMTFYLEDAIVERHRGIIEAIVSNFQDLETLGLAMVMQEDWLAHLSRLRKLNRLSWYIPASGYVEVDESQFGCLYKSLEFSETRVRTLIEQSFKDFKANPWINVEMLEEDPDWTGWRLLLDDFNSVTPIDTIQ
jgi:hypothetical protein